MLFRGIAVCEAESWRSSVLLARARKDAKLCFRAPEEARPRRFYAIEKFTPEQVRQDESRAFRFAKTETDV